MMQPANVKVLFNTENVNKCLCPKCPVQRNSQCVSHKMLKIEYALDLNPLEHEEIPGEYCAAGTATCQDIDTSRACSCFGCPVYSTYNLTSGQPTCYFCRDGMAIQSEEPDKSIRVPDRDK